MMGLKVFFSVFAFLLTLQGLKAFSKIPITIRIEDADSINTDVLTLRCSFLLGKGRKLNKLEWQTISGSQTTKMISVGANGESEIQKDYSDVIIGSGLIYNKKLSTHWMTLLKRKAPSVNLYKCVVHDDKWNLGSKDYSTKPVTKELLPGSGDGGSGGSGEVTCGGNYTGPVGSILSPNYPSNYPDNSECVWTVTVEPGQIINFDFSFLDLEGCCGCDFLDIRDGSTEFDPLIATVCYTHDTTEFFKTTGNTGYVEFTSDFSISGLGFNLYWEAGPQIICGGDLTGSSGMIESPNFPFDYPDFSDCVWTITVDESSTIFFEMLAFDLENCCPCDNLEVRDGANDFDTLLITFCDPLENGTTVQTSGNTAHVRFRSDLSVVASGFQLYWEARAVETTTEVPSSDFYAFSASLSGDEAVDSGAIVFDSVLYNQQEIYNPATGVFSPPVHGLYFVTTSCLSTAGTNFRVYIRRNQDEILCKSFAAADDSFAGTCSAVEEMFPGDEIRVTGDDEFPGTAVGDRFSGFTGYMIARLD